MLCHLARHRPSAIILSRIKDLAPHPKGVIRELNKGLSSLIVQVQCWSSEQVLLYLQDVLSTCVCQMENNNWSLFSEAIELIFRRWTALQLASTSDEISNLRSTLLQYFQDGEVEFDSLEYNFYEYFNDLGVEVEDGSLGQVTNELLQFRDEIWMNDLSRIIELRSMNPADSTEDIVMEKVKPVRQEAVIDDDGFELVQKKRR